MNNFCCRVRARKPGFFECPSMPGDCNAIVTPWAVGAKPFVFPDNVGGELGRNTGTLNLVAQMHYDNPLHVEGLVDATVIEARLLNVY